MRETSEANQFLDREPRRSMEGLSEDGEGFGKLPGIPFPEFPAINGYRAFGGFQKAADNVEHRALSGAIAADKGHHPVRGKPRTDVPEHESFTVFFGNVSYLNHIRLIFMIR